MTATDKILTMEIIDAEIRRLRRRRHLINLIHKMLPRRRLRQVVRHGVRWNLQYRGGVDAGIIKRGFVERESFAYFIAESRRRRCEVFLDVGAHIGWYCVMSAKTGAFAKIHAMEAMPDNFARLQWHVRENNLGDVITARNIAVSDRCGEVLMSEGLMTSQRKISAEGKMRVPCATLDSMFDFYGETVAIKMDVEGHEIPALSGAEKLLSQNRIFLQVEVWAHGVETIYYLLECGFRLLHHCESNFYFAKGFGDD